VKTGNLENYFQVKNISQLCFNKRFIDMKKNINIIRKNETEFEISIFKDREMNF